MMGKILPFADWRRQVPNRELALPGRNRAEFPRALNLCVLWIEGFQESLLILVQAKSILEKTPRQKGEKQCSYI